MLPYIAAPWILYGIYVYIYMDIYIYISHLFLLHLHPSFLPLLSWKPIPFRLVSQSKEVKYFCRKGLRFPGNPPISNLCDKSATALLEVLRPTGRTEEFHFLRNSITIQAHLSSQTVPAPVHPWRPVIAAEITTLDASIMGEKSPSNEHISCICFTANILVHVGSTYFDAHLGKWECLCPMHQDTLPWLVVEAARNLEKNSKVTCGCSQLGLESNVYSKPPPQKIWQGQNHNPFLLADIQFVDIPVFFLVKPEFFLCQISFLQIPSLLKLYMYQLSSTTYMSYMYIYLYMMYICILYDIYNIHTYMYIVSYITCVLKHGVFRFNGFSELLQPTWCGTSGRSVATNLRFKSNGYLMVI